ncbi:MAG: hypothetical protein CME06_02215 [Gemmatimonadetes bacterium]|nr:hypothetical protein [Gemmatimonadota bacterium]
MRGLFLRLWLMVFVVCSAIGGLGWLYDQYLYPPQYASYHESLLLGPLLNQGDELLADPKRAGEVSEEYGYPVRVMEWDLLPNEVQEEFEWGMELVWHYAAEEYIFVLIGEGDHALRLGPLPPYPNTEYYVTIGLVLLVPLLGALAIRRLLRPVERELRMVESTAAQIAGGDLAARAPVIEGPTHTLAGALNRMAETTASTIESQRELLRAVSHELRTPLARIQTAMHILTHVEDRAERDRRLEELDLDFEELSRLVDELLTYARLESGDPCEGTTWPAKELEDLVGGMADEAAGRGIALILDAGLEEGTELAADPRLFRRVVGNLLSNALRHAQGEVKVGAVAEKVSLVVSVEDDGPGVPVEERERVFEPFVRLNRAAGGTGYGIGLAIVRRVAERHGGEAWIEEGFGGGCRVIVRWGWGGAAK